MTRSKWTAEEDQRLRDLLATQLGNAEIVAAFPDRSKQAVTQRIFRLRVDPSEPVDSPVFIRTGRRGLRVMKSTETRHRCAELARQGLSNIQIAEALGISVWSAKSLAWRELRRTNARRPDRAPKAKAAPQPKRKSVAPAPKTSASARAKIERRAQEKAELQAAERARKAAEKARERAERAAERAGARRLKREADKAERKAEKERALAELLRADAERERAAAERLRREREAAQAAEVDAGTAARLSARSAALSPRDARDLVQAQVARVSVTPDDAALFEMVLAQGLDHAARRAGMPASEVKARWDALTGPLRVPAARRVAGGRWRVCRAMPLAVQAALGDALAARRAL